MYFMLVLRRSNMFIAPKTYDLFAPAERNVSVTTWRSDGAQN